MAPAPLLVRFIIYDIWEVFVTGVGGTLLSQCDTPTYHDRNSGVEADRVVSSSH
jgi:hypothetical protein